MNYVDRLEWIARKSRQNEAGLVWQGFGGYPTVLMKLKFLNNFAHNPFVDWIAVPICAAYRAYDDPFTRC